MVWKFRNLFPRGKEVATSASKPDVESALSWFQRGSDHVSRKEWQPALECFREATRSDPHHADAHAFAGNVLRQLGEFEEASAAYDKAISANPHHLQALYNRGTLWQHLRQPEKALQSFDAVISIEPTWALAQRRRAETLRTLGESEAAEAAYRQAISFSPSDMGVRTDLGLFLGEVGRYDEALATFDAIDAASRGAAAHAGRGAALVGLGRTRDALASYDAAIQLQPDFARVFSNRAQALEKLGLLSEARDNHVEAVRLDPSDPAIHFNFGSFLSDRKEWQAAAISYERAIELKSNYAEAHCNLGLAQQEMQMLDLALASYGRALGYDPNLASALNNRGNLRRYNKQFGEALRDFGKALEINPEMAEVHYNIGQVALLQGDFSAGWKEYEWRESIDEAKPFTRRLTSSPRWAGEVLLGKRILLYAEQGFGDTIQFCRYVPLVANLGARVILEVQPALVKLLAGVLGAAQVVAAGADVPECDFHCSLMSLPGVFGTTFETIPADVPYLFADPLYKQRWSERLGPARLPRVGLIWSGNPRQSNDHNRSMSLSLMLPHLPGRLEYFCLQKDVRQADQEAMDSHGRIKIRQPSLDTFMDTAALLDMMDVVVSVDTSVAHLSGAMGRPTWILLCALPDWRYFLERSDSPWYPTARLYRQPSPGDWSSVLVEVKNDLLGLETSSRRT